MDENAVWLAYNGRHHYYGVLRMDVNAALETDSLACLPAPAAVACPALPCRAATDLTHLSRARICARICLLWQSFVEPSTN